MRDGLKDLENRLVLLIGATKRRPEVIITLGDDPFGLVEHLPETLRVSGGHQLFWFRPLQDVQDVVVLYRQTKATDKRRSGRKHTGFCLRYLSSK